MLHSNKTDPVKLTALADDLNVNPGRLLTLLRDRSFTVMMFLRNGIRQQWVLFRDQQGQVHQDSYPEDDEHFDDITCPLNKHALNCLIDNGLFEFYEYTRDTGNGTGEQVYCLEDDGFSKRLTVIRIKNLYVSPEDAATLKSHTINLPTPTEAGFASTEAPPLTHLKAVRQTPPEDKTPSQQGDLWLVGDDEICSFFNVGVNSITSIRRLIKKAGISGFDKDPVTGKKRLSLIDAHTTKVMKSKKKAL